ncbi:ASC1-like protein 1, partial [Bienertia sinuspersici]
MIVKFDSLSFLNSRYTTIAAVPPLAPFGRLPTIVAPNKQPVFTVHAYLHALIPGFATTYIRKLRTTLEKPVKVNYGDVDAKKKLRKFKESAWKCVYYLSAEILALSVTYNEPWFTETKYFWVGPGDQVWPDQKVKMKLQGLYMYAAGFYTYSIFALIFWETRRSDFGVSMGHHVATLILIVLSYIFRYVWASVCFLLGRRNWLCILIIRCVFLDALLLPIMLHIFVLN